MPERLEDEKGIEHIASAAVPTTTLYDICVVLVTHATNMQILMGDPDCRPYLKSLQVVHEDLVWILGIMQMAFGITPGEVVDYTTRRREENAFQELCTPEEIERERRAIAERNEHHGRMYQ